MSVINTGAGVVISDYHHLRGGGGRAFAFTIVVLGMSAVAPQSAYIMNRKLQPDS